MSDESLTLERDLTVLKEKLNNLDELKIKTEHELDGLHFDFDEQHSTINSLTLEVRKLTKLKRQAEKELENLEDSQNHSSLPATPLKRVVEIDAPKIDLYTKEQFASYDEAIERLPDINELMQKLRDFIIGEDAYTEVVERILDFDKIAKNCAAIRQFLEEYNNYEIKIREARLTEQEVTRLEEERLEGECNKINKELWDLFNANEDLKNMKFIVLRIKYSLNSNNPLKSNDPL